MIDPAVKTAMAFCVVLAGVCAAMLFRNDRPRTAVPRPSAEEQLLLRYRIDAPKAVLRQRAAVRSGSFARDLPEALPAPRPATVVMPSDSRELPPPLAQDYPEPERPASSRWGTSMDMLLPIAAPADHTARTHRIVDGDTLAALAQRYLGSTARAREIYDANRDVLSDPDLLPIGVELKLPPRAGLSPPQRTLGSGKQ
jgi:nucleoid-associated protein YgaU